MTKLMRVGIAMLWALACNLLTLTAHAEVAVPPLRAHVTDLTHTLSSDQVASLEQTLSAFEQRKGSQIAVLMIPTTQPEAIEQYSLRVAETWKIGRKGVDDGVLLVIAKDDHALRIETGYGVEGAVPDALAKRIIREVITPSLRAGNFYLGIQQGVDQIIAAVEGEPLPPSANRALDEPTGNSRGTGRGIGRALPFLLVAALAIGGVLRAVFGRMGGALFAGAAAGFIGWMIMRAIPLAAVFAVIAFFATMFGNSRGGWSSGSGGFGGGFGGGSSGGGGWSGGGGGFGGGGASGRW